jgi:hypothetical protein
MQTFSQLNPDGWLAYKTQHGFHEWQCEKKNTQSFTLPKVISTNRSTKAKYSNTWSKHLILQEGVWCKFKPQLDD